jgi:hypothetical protein
MPSRKCYRCRLCGRRFNAWRPWAKAPNGVLRFGHVSQHPDQMRPYLRRIEAGECLDRVIVEAYELIEGDEDPT